MAAATDIALGGTPSSASQRAVSDEIHPARVASLCTKAHGSFCLAVDGLACAGRSYRDTAPGVGSLRYSPAPIRLAVGLYPGIPCGSPALVHRRNRHSGERIHRIARVV